jgi:hypothetical protein
LQHQIHVFVDFERQIVTLVTTYGRTTTVKLLGTIRLVLEDDTGKPGHMTFLMLSMIQNHHILIAFLSLVNTLLEMMKQMYLMNKHGYDPHQQHPFSNGTMANVNGFLNMETLICKNY